MNNFISQMNVCKSIGLFNAKPKKKEYFMSFIYKSEYIFSYQKIKLCNQLTCTGCSWYIYLHNQNEFTYYLKFSDAIFYSRKHISYAIKFHIKFNSLILFILNLYS